MLEKHYVTLSKQLIEERLFPHKHGEKLSQRDFNDLSVQIEEKCGVVLSLSTLKRLWKDDFKQPHPATLDALVSVLGFAHWNDFKRSNSLTLEQPASPAISKAKKTIKRYMVTFFSTSLLILLAFIYLSFVKEDNTEIRINGEISFSADKTVSSGVPNTVVFHYDLDSIRADSFFIQQSWDARNKEPIQKEDAHLSSVYYFPGYHKAKLIANDSILFVKPIHITTEGWFPLAFHGYYPKIPNYISGGVHNEKGLHVSKDQLLSANINPSDNFVLSLFNVRDFDDLPSTNFTVSCSMRLEKLPQSVCSNMEVQVLCEKHIFYLQFAEKGCVGELRQKIGEKVLNGKYSDFSGFGVEAGTWQDIQLSVENKKAIVYKEGVEIYKTEFNEDLGSIKGLVFSFENTLGSVSKVTLQNVKGETIYTESFSKNSL